jgi:hypothetical protein
LKKAVRLLRISYWVGAVLDAINVIPLALPQLGAKMLGLTEFKITPEFSYVSYIGASLMLGWTVLLIWADRKPIERMGVLLITVFPVVLGIAFSGMYLYIVGILSLTSLLPLLFLPIFIISLFLFSYFYAKAGMRKI